jgi:hypothetical protein
MADEAEEFKWDDDEAVVVKTVHAVAVYRNAADEIVIRQETRTYDDEDPFIVVPESQLPKLIEALKRQLA